MVPPVANEEAATPGKGHSAIVFGASGTLGTAISFELLSQGVPVTCASRRPGNATDIVTSSPNWGERLAPQSVSRVIWAQGANASDQIATLTGDDLRPILEANVLFVVDSLHELLSRDCLTDGASLVIVSSVWQTLARQGKASYVTSKAAVGGLVRALSADLGDKGVRVNAVLPGVVDSPMTRQFLSSDTIQKITEDTPGQQLVEVKAVAEVCAWLSGPGSRGVNGQSIVVDGGWSVFRRL